MKRILINIALLFPVALLLSCGGGGGTFTTGDPARAGFDAARLQRVDSLMAKYTREGLMPCVVSFVARRGQVVHHAAYGFKDAEAGVPAAVTDIYREASQTKAITAAVLLSLWEENYFHLDDPLKLYLPAFANPRVRVSGSVETGDLVTRPAKRDITIRHLLCHSSGYGYGAFGEDLRVINYPDPVETAEVVERVARTPLMHDPGENYTYGFGLDIAGHLAEVLTGKSLDVLMRERIFEPLGMNDTHFYLPADKRDRLVKMYRRDTDSTRCYPEPDVLEQTYPLATNQPYHGGGAGLCGTIGDYAKFCQMILDKGVFNGRRVLGRRTVELMTANHLATSRASRQYGLGMGIIADGDYPANIMSPGTVRWGGAYKTEFLIDPKEEMIILMYVNMTTFHRPALYNRFLASVYQAMQ
ncbi:MAG: beta-lactamase family protein [Odoribacteraceae bacterium]|jgi:CubicO group peptidase (beta-lactamase class C family)|nr:beta-lactamase family protein [Odoribacteraceae bacterium]